MTNLKFGIGTKSFYETFSGLVPCIVTGVHRTELECDGRYVGPLDAIEFKLTADRGAYKRGEILTSSAADVPPRVMVRRRRCGATVRTNYTYTQEKS